MPVLVLFCVLHILLLCPASAETAAVHEKILFCIENQNEEILYSKELPEQTLIGIRFIHSVAKSPVEEWFSVQRDGLVLQKTVYNDFGAGLPYQPESGQTMEFTGGHIIIRGYDRKFKKFDLRVGRIAEHTLLLPAKDSIRGNITYEEVPLSTLSTPGSALTFTVRERYP